MNIRLTIKKIIMFIMYPYWFIKRTEIDNTSWICNNCNVQHSTIGRYCYINRCSDINHANIGNYTSIGPFVSIGGENHSIHYVSTSDRLSELGVSNMVTYIGHDVWIGTQVCIKQGVKIGNGAVIGANSFVNKDVPPFAIVVGSPAKIIRYRFSPEIISEIEKSNYWDMCPDQAKDIIEHISKKHKLI